MLSTCGSRSSRMLPLGLLGACPVNKSHIKFIRNFESKWKVAAVRLRIHSLTHTLTHLAMLLLWPFYTIFWCEYFCITLYSYQDILHIPTSFQQFSTSLGPIVDGHVIPNQPYKVMGHYTEHFSRFVKQLLSQFSQPSIFALDLTEFNPLLTSPYLPNTHTIGRTIYLLCDTWLDVWHLVLAFGIWHWVPSGEIKSLVKSKYAFCGLTRWMAPRVPLVGPQNGSLTLHLTMVALSTFLASQKFLKYISKKFGDKSVDQKRNEYTRWASNLLEFIFGFLCKIIQRAMKIITVYFKYSNGLRPKLFQIYRALFWWVHYWF